MLFYYKGLNESLSWSSVVMTLKLFFMLSNGILSATVIVGAATLFVSGSGVYA
jgi:hypothetical protein